MLVAAKLAVPADSSAQQVAGAIDEAEARVRSVLSIGAMIFLEPDIDREPAEAATDPAVPADHGRGVGSGPVRPTPAP